MRGVPLAARTALTLLVNNKTSTAAQANKRYVYFIGQSKVPNVRLTNVWFFVRVCLYNSKGASGLQSPNCAGNSACGCHCTANLYHTLFFNAIRVTATNLRMRKLTLVLLCLVQTIAQCLAPFVTVSLVGVGRAQAEGDASSAVIINEIHYDPRSKAAGEFVEIYNAGTNIVNLTGWSLDKGIDYVFPPGAQVFPRAYVVVARNPEVLRQTYGASALGPFAGRLSNDVDDLALYDRSGQLVDEVNYSIGFPWPTPNDDADQSIGLTNQSLDNSIPGAWRSGAPTPGWGNSNLLDNPAPFVDAISHSPVAPRGRRRDDQRPRHRRRWGRQRASVAPACSPWPIHPPQRPSISN